MPNSDVYRYPQYYAIGYRWNTEAECRFIEACLKAHGPAQAARLLDIGCGSGRHMLELAKRGYQMTGIDVSPEMVSFVEEAARRENFSVAVSVGDLRRMKLQGTYDAAYCFMDTFRFLLTNQQILTHLRTLAKHLTSGGLYLTDFWVPNQWDQIGNEVYQWEQEEGDTTVRVLYLQHPDSIDPIAQTFEDELVFEIHEGDATNTIRGGRTRTRLLMTQEFLGLVEASGVFETLGVYGGFDLSQPLDPSTLSWRMVSVLKKR